MKGQSNPDMDAAVLDIKSIDITLIWTAEYSSIKIAIDQSLKHNLPQMFLDCIKLRENADTV